MHKSGHIHLRLLVTACALATVAGVFLLAGAAGASPQVTIAAGNPANNQAVTVSGSGFPSRDQDPSGVQIIECADPGGVTANLPTTASSCDGATQNPLPVNVDANGSFTTKYTFVSLNGQHGTSNIACDTTHTCVLWVGVDYNNSFLGVHAFSTPFKVGGPHDTGSSSDTLLIVLLIVAAVVVVGAVVMMRRRRAGRQDDPVPSKTAAGA